MTPSQIEGVLERARCLFTETEVEAAIDRMAVEITAALADRNPVLTVIMHGGLIVAGKLAPRLVFPLQMDYLHATRYREATRGADLQWRAYPSLALAGRTVLLVDDILDEGVTLSRVKAYCRAQGCREVVTAVLVDKQHDRKQESEKAEFVGLQAADHYLFGYGMDFRGYLRNAAGIYAVAPDDM